MSARYTERGAEKVYAVAQEWANCALRADGSLFTPGKPIWTPKLLGELHTRFLDKPDASGDGGFWGKLQRQLDNSPPEVYQLMGEMLYVHYLPRSTKAETKRNAVETPLGWSPSPVAIPQEFADVFQDGFVGVGPGGGLIPFWVGTLIESLEQWKKLDPDDREQLLHDPWRFRDFLFGRSLESLLLKPAPGKGVAQRHLLLHILFPDTFERILANDKGAICQAKAFAPFIDPQEQETDNVDRKIQQIRQAIEEKLEKDFDFYDPCIVKYWKPPKGVPAVEVFCAGEKVCRQKGDGLKDLADQLYLPVDFLQEINDLLAEKKQVIFQGPPGTGKTFVARELAQFLAGGADHANRVTLVQFHPSYAYEDFVQGFRPTPAAEGQVGFTLRDGPLLRAAERARQDPDAKHYLIIDEINRGNLAAVFGELYFLLEYRGEKMKLQYSETDFALPENLFILGTMNTADRSIALVDLALRRRFYFVEFRPDEEPVNGVLRRWLGKNAPGMEWVAEVVDLANRLLKDSDAANAALGPSYFMQDDLTEDKVALIWRHSILPYLEERLYGDSDVRTKYALARLRRQVSGQSGEGNAAEPEEASGNETGNGGA